MSPVRYEREIPTVSMIISNYTYGRYLREATNSALNQTYQPIEVIAVDARATDHSSEIILVYGTRAAFSPFFVGLGGIRNKARGDYILFLNSDD